MFINWVAANNAGQVITPGDFIMDAVAIASILAVGITIVIVVFLAVKISYLINHSHSDDK